MCTSSASRHSSSARTTPRCYAAASHDQRIRLTLVGSGSSRAALEALAASLSISDRVAFLGQLDHAEVDALYHPSASPVSVVALPSTSEGIPVSLMEALGHGFPVVASDVGGVAELVEPTRGHLLTDPFDDQALSDALIEAASTWTADDANRAHAFVRDEFGADSTSRTLLDHLG